MRTQFYSDFYETWDLQLRRPILFHHALKKNMHFEKWKKCQCIKTELSCCLLALKFSLRTKSKHYWLPSDNRKVFQRVACSWTKKISSYWDTCITCKITKKVTFACRKSLIKNYLAHFCNELVLQKTFL